MKHLALSVLVLALVTGALLHDVAAQDQIVTEAPAASSTPAVEAPPPQKTYEEYQRDALEQSARQSRNALIGLSAATVVGTALVFPAIANQCFTFSVPGSTEIRCTSAGKAMLGIGWPLFFGGMTGVVITGIMFGVRKGKLRRLDDRMAYERSRAVRWDPASARFVF